MKVLTVTENHELELKNIPDITPSPYEVLVKIKACGICSTTDREIIKGTQPYHNAYPCILGHEAIGEVIEVGSKVISFKKGDMVTRPSSLLPGESRDGLHSGWGGFAEYGIVRDGLAMSKDGDDSLVNDYTFQRQNVVDPALGVKEAVLAIALSETASWLWELPQLGGKTVIVAGTGIAGLSIMLWAKLAGAKNVIALGRRDERLDLARELAANDGFKSSDADLAERINSKYGKADVFVEAVGNDEMINLGLPLIAPGEIIALYGVTQNQTYQLDWSKGPGQADIRQLPTNEHLAYPWVAELIKRRLIPVDKLLTHQWNLSEYDEAFKAVAAGKVIKGMLTM
jgi:threonine dehydrogenase-like Zn-dependent dehydrogenase